MDHQQGQEELLCVKDACKQFAKPVPRTTLADWISRGVLNKFTKERIHLTPTPHGGSVLIERSAITIFIKRLNSRVPTNDDGTPKEAHP